jgi:MFS family permease
MNTTNIVDRRLWLAGALFGLAIGVVLSWTTYLNLFLAVRGLPIDATSFGVRGDTVALVVAIYTLGSALGGFLVARFWGQDRAWLPLLLGALATMLVRVSVGYVSVVASLEGNQFAEFIIYNLPVGLLFGAGLWFLGGLLGSLLEYWLLDRAALWLELRRAALAFGVLVVVGIGLGLIAGGVSSQRNNAIMAAQAVNGAVRVARGEQPSAGELPEGFRASDLTLKTLRGFGDQIQQPYQIFLADNFVYRSEVVTDIRFTGGLVVRCVSNGAQVSRCFENTFQ